MTPTKIGDSGAGKTLVEVQGVSQDGVPYRGCYELTAGCHRLVVDAIKPGVVGFWRDCADADEQQIDGRVVRWFEGADAIPQGE